MVTKTQFSLDIKKFVLGQCFLCHEPCEGYVHGHCADVLYWEKEKRIKEAQLKVDAKFT